MKSGEKKAEAIIKVIRDLSSINRDIAKKTKSLKKVEEKQNDLIDNLNQLFKKSNKLATTDVAVWLGRVLTNIDELRHWCVDSIIGNEFNNIILTALIKQTNQYELNKDIVLARLTGTSNIKTIQKALTTLITPVIPILEIPNSMETPDLAFLTDEEIEILRKIRIKELNSKYKDLLLFHPQKEYVYNSRVRDEWIANQPYNNNFIKIVNFCLLLSYKTYTVSDYLIKLANKIIINFPYFKSLNENARNIGIRIIQTFWIINDFSTKELYTIMSKWFDIEPSTIKQICFNPKKYSNL